MCNRLMTIVVMTLAAALYAPSVLSATSGESGVARKAALAATIARLWQALSHGPEQGADTAALRELFHPRARVYGVNPRSQDASLRIREADAFIAAQGEPGDAFHEKEVYRHVTVHADFAHVLSTVESRRDPADVVPLLTGINSIQLHWDGTAWRIVSLYYRVDAPGEPIPPRWRRAD